MCWSLCQAFSLLSTCLTPPLPPSCLSCYWRSLERLSPVLMQLGGRYHHQHHYAGVMGVKHLWNSNVVLQRKQTTTNICLWMTARWRISPMEVIHQIQWPPLTLCWSTNVPCCSQHRQRLVFMLAPAHNLNMSRCYFQKSLQCVLATGNLQKSPYPFQEITQGTNAQLLQRGCTQSCSICMSHGNSSPQPWNLDRSSSLPQFSTAVIRPSSSPTGGVSDCD